MPSNTRVYRFDEEKSLEQGPATLGAWIRDVPRDWVASGGGWRCVAVSDARHLICWGADDGVFMYDFIAGRWLDPLEVGLPDDAQHAEEVAISDICCTRDYLLIGIGGLYFVLAFSDLKFWKERWGEEIFHAGMAIPAEDAGERYKDMIFTYPADGALGVDLISVQSREIHRQYRFPTDQPEPRNYLVKGFDYGHGLMLATILPSLVRDSGEEEESPTYHLAWDLETGELVHRKSLIPPYRQEDCWGPFLNDHYLHFENVLVEVPSFRPVRTFDADDIVGIAGDQVVTAKWDPDQDTILEIYQLPGFQKVHAVKIEGYSWGRELHSRKYFLLAKKGAERDFILVNLEDFVKKSESW